MQCLNANPSDKGFILETAHPVKFGDTVEGIINEEVAIPESVKYLLDLDKKSTLMSPSFADFKQLLISRD